MMPVIFNSKPKFSWVSEPEFTPPDKDCGASACLSQEFKETQPSELKALLGSFLEIIISTVNATAGVVRLLTPDGKSLAIISSAAISRELQAEAENFVGLDCEVMGKAALDHVVYASDLSVCSSKSNCPHTNCQFQSRVVAPLESSKNPGTAIGILTIFFDIPHESASCMMNTVVSFADVMCATIEHARSNREINRLERLAARQGIANEIHDSLAQTLTFARMRTSLLNDTFHASNELLHKKYVHDIDSALELGQRNVRELIADFRCELHHEGISIALQELAQTFIEHNDIDLEYHNKLVDLELPLEYEIQAYYIVQEALNNIARHSGSTHARLFVDARYGYYIFTIEDNGSGASSFMQVEGHYGMKIMRERAQRIGGEIRVKSTSGLGTQVQLFFAEPPLNWRAINE